MLGGRRPAVSHVTIWGTSGPLGFNKTAAIYLFAAVATMLVFFLGDAPKKQLVPPGMSRTRAESGVDFVRNQVIMQTIGADGLGYLPYLDDAVLLHLLQQHHRDHPGRPVPRERALRRCRSSSR